MSAVPQPDFRALFESAPGLYLVLDPQLRIVALSDAYARATLIRREAVIGRHIFEVFPDNPDDPQAAGTRHLKASLDRVLRECAGDAMPVQKYDIPDPATPGAFEARYWSPSNSPVTAADGSVAYIIHRVEDVTEFVRAKAAQSAGREPAAAAGGAIVTTEDAASVEAGIYARAREVAQARELLEQRVAERTAELEANNQKLRDSRRAALNLVEDAVHARQEAEQALARAQLLLKHLSLLDQITRSVGERLDLASIFRVVVSTLEENLNLDLTCICLYDPAANRLTPEQIGALGADRALKASLTGQSAIPIPVDANGLSQCIAGKLVYEPDIASLPYPFAVQLARGGLRSLVMAPLRSESSVFGVLLAARCEAQGFGSVECEFLRQLSEHVALAAQQAQLYGALQTAYDELRQTQQAAMQQDRLLSLGQMASGIAHDINNALSPVSLYAESLLESEHGMSSRARGYIETIQRAVEDVANTVARMREFYRKRDPQLVLTPVKVNRILDQVLDLTRARWHDMPQQHGIVIDARSEPAAGEPTIMGIESELREALTNLVFNAVDAMPEGGTLRLRSHVLEGSPSGNCVVIEVADSGSGMDEETRKRCLEPFFTTKGERGTGLGLAMVFGIVQRHNGELEVESAPGAGTRFRMVFGVREAAPVQPGETWTAAKPIERLRLLIVDDDPIILKSLRESLETDGHLVQTANGGAAGIEAFRASCEGNSRFDAVITDLGMPHIDGRRVAGAVKLQSPDTPVILLTGWGRRLVAEGDIPAHVDRVLAKPPKLREIRATLEQLCGAAARPPT